ncbi:putative ABC transporter permease [Clostridium taeniosporum]|nr:putative ABC transporter permease [Clostridium taeniosporum]
MSYTFFNFIIYSFIGWIIEEVYYFCTKGKFKEDGFLIGPFKPMYGIVVSVLIVLNNYLYDKTSIMIMFCFFVPSIIEYISGYLLKSIFNKVYWDYSKLKYNLDGLVSLKFSAYWTLMTFLGLKYIEPFFHNIFIRNESIFLGLTVMLTIYLSVDFYLTVHSLLKTNNVSSI